MRGSKEEKILDGIVLARKLATMCPTSLSVDDLQDPSRLGRRPVLLPQRTFVKPSSSVVVIKEETTKTNQTPAPITTKRFAWLSSQVKKESVQKDVIQMQYELPNTEIISPAANGRRPLRVVAITKRESRSAYMSCESECDISL